jgi:hypothetical protein
MTKQPVIEQPTPDLPQAIGPGPSPFWPQHLIDLFVRPTRFFVGHLALGRTPYVVLVTSRPSLPTPPRGSTTR